MIRAHIALCACLILAACGEGREDARSPQVANEAVPANSAAPHSAQAVNTTTSIMRPSVVAETEQEVPPPAPQPVKATIFFDSDLQLDDAARSTLNALLETPAAAGEAKIVIRGHSDSRGRDSENLRVSRLRAEAVGDYLVQRGVPAGRMEIIALGETRPIAPNAHPDGSDFEEGRRKNRRVVVEVIPQAGEEPESSPGAAQTSPKKSAHLR